MNIATKPTQNTSSLFFDFKLTSLKIAFGNPNDAIGGNIVEMIINKANTP